MMDRYAALGCLALALLSGGAHANVPVRDSAILDRRSETASVKVRLLDTTKKTETSTKGIRCATTTGQRGTTRDTTQPIVPNGGDQRVQQFDPGIQRPSGSTGSSGQNAQLSALINGASTVAGGIDTQQSIIPDSQNQYRRMTNGVGTAPTVMGALDQNSAVRIQNGITWNQVAQSANLLVQSLNTANLGTVSDMSALSGAINPGVSLPPSTGSGGMCLAGYVGRGTSIDPCRPANVICSTTQPGIAPDPACVSQRYIDDRGNVAFYLGMVQSAALRAVIAAPSAPFTPPVGSTPSAADLAAALRQYE